MDMDGTYKVNNYMLSEQMHSKVTQSISHGGLDSQG